MLMQTCVGGTGSAVQGNARTVCHRNQTLPLSPGLATQLDFGAEFDQRSVRLDIARLEALCSRWLNHPLDGPLRFELRPFSATLERARAEAVALIMTYERMNIALPAAVLLSFDEFMLSLVLAQHPHNYSDDMRRHSPVATPRMVREAEHWMRTGGPEISVSSIADRIGVSMRTLESGFLEWRQATPTQYLRKVRLDAARAQLLAPAQDTTATSAALGNGFFHLARFSAHYKAAFYTFALFGVRTAERVRFSSGFASMYLISSAALVASSMLS
jgi:AraC-like DNA-binding protein